MNWLFAIIILSFGLFSLDNYSILWAALSLFIYSIPLFGQLLRSQLIRVWSIFFGVFMIMQSVISAHLNTDDLKTLSPNMNIEHNITNGYQGLEGINHLTTDAKGFRTTGEIDYHDDSTYRVFTIGGSTTEQILIDDKKNWSYLLKDEIQKRVNSPVEVINTGVSGLRVRHHLATLKYIEAFHPDLVIFLFGINDWNWHIMQEQVPDGIWKRFNRLRQQFMFSHSLLGNMLMSYRVSQQNQSSAPVKKSVTGQFHNQYRGSLNKMDRRSSRIQHVLPDYKETVIQIVEHCQSRQINCVFMTQPHGYQPHISKDYRDSFWMTPPKAEFTLSIDDLHRIAVTYNSYLLEYGNSAKVPVCDLGSAMNASFKHFSDECHFNLEGSRRVATFLGQCLQDNNVLKN